MYSGLGQSGREMMVEYVQQYRTPEAAADYTLSVYPVYGFPPDMVARVTDPRDTGYNQFAEWVLRLGRTPESYFEPGGPGADLVARAQEMERRLAGLPEEPVRTTYIPHPSGLVYTSDLPPGAVIPEPPPGSIVPPDVVIDYSQPYTPVVIESPAAPGVQPPPSAVDLVPTTPVPEVAAPSPFDLGTIVTVIGGFLILKGLFK